MRSIRTIGIRGAGLSGLSMAQALHFLDPKLSITVYDIRPKNPHPQRTFCFFKTHAINLLDIPCHSWPSVTFKSNNFSRTIDVSATPYTMVSGDNFFNYTLNKLEASGVIFNWGCDTVSIGPDWIEANSVKRHFDYVIDAAFCPTKANSYMWQSFAGMWVETDQPVFKTNSATLMDLQLSSRAAPVNFIYALPTSPYSALIEHTTFSPTPLTEKQHLQYCHMWSEKQLNTQFRICSLERGIIPMGLVVPKMSAGPLIVGSNAGSVQAATGYSFATTQRNTAQLARAIIEQRPIPPCPYPDWLKSGDRIFLRALQRDPLMGGYIMEQLLLRAPAKALIAFLSGSPSFFQACSLWLSAPKFSMLISLLRR